MLSYDQDEAGKNAVRRCIDIFREAGGKTRVVTFEGAKDPDEYVAKYGAVKFIWILGSFKMCIRDRFRKEGAIVYTGKGSYAEAVNKKGGFSGSHKNYVERAIELAIFTWMKSNGIKGRITND